MGGVERVSDACIRLWGSRLLVGRGLGAVESILIDPFDGTMVGGSTPLVPSANSLSCDSALGTVQTLDAHAAARNNCTLSDAFASNRAR